MSNLESMKATAPYAGKSRVVALAGANRGMGQHVAEALLEAGFKVVLLLRKVFNVLWFFIYTR
jgi:NADP-dependent 3-hydroxy acid dehydrogenase YdfG